LHNIHLKKLLSVTSKLSTYYITPIPKWKTNRPPKILQPKLHYRQAEKTAKIKTKNAKKPKIRAISVICGKFSMNYEQ